MGVIEEETKSLDYGSYVQPQEWRTKWKSEWKIKATHYLELAKTSHDKILQIAGLLVRNLT